MKNNPFYWKKFDWEPLPFTEMESVTTDEGRHYVTPIGDLPSMTTILSCLDDGGIDKWVKRVGKEDSERIKNEASERGNSLHDLNELYLRNELERSQLTGKGKVLFNRTKGYLDLINPVLATEIPLYSKKYRFAGRVDCVAYVNGVLYIIDHKNSRRPINKRKHYARRKLFKYMLQTVGYAICIEEMYQLYPQKGALIVGNHETSNSDWFEFDINDLKEEFDKMVLISQNKLDKNESMYFQL